MNPSSTPGSIERVQEKVKVIHLDYPRDLGLMLCNLNRKEGVWVPGTFLQVEGCHYASVPGSNVKWAQQVLK